jgi:outer membrane protein TolC
MPDLNAAVRGIARGAMGAIAALLVAACVPEGAQLTSADPATAWSDGGARAAGDFSVSGDPAIGQVPPGIRSDRAYDLPQLIDLAQRSNPATRVAWEQARQAAAAVGLVEASYLPIISANVIGGRQEIVTPVPDLLRGGTTNLETTVTGVSPNIALQWLVFDFGQRDALRDGARQAAYAANVLFNGAHQAVIYDVTSSFYIYGAARQNVAIAEQALANSRLLEEAADARFRNGIGNSVEVAQARQLAAQSNLRLVQARDTQRDAYQGLLGAVGISPRSSIRVASSVDRRLPAPRAVPTDSVIEAALSRRPDVLASYAAVRASAANQTAAQAAFLPKVYLGAIAGPNRVGLQTGNLTGVSGQSTTTGLIMGVTVPIYDGGLRAARQRQAEAATRQAQATFSQVRDAAMREIVVASDTLRSALEAHAAAEELTRAAQTTYDAAFQAYRNGLGTLTDATAANTGLLDARQARADAHAASLVAAATLAFTLGAMTSRTAPDQAIGR